MVEAFYLGVSIGVGLVVGATITDALFHFGKYLTGKYVSFGN